MFRIADARSPRSTPRASAVVLTRAARGTAVTGTALMTTAITVALLGCASPTVARPIDGAHRAAYPEGPYDIVVGAVLPDLSFDGVDADGAARAIALHELAANDRGDPSVAILVVSGGAWCGTCAWTTEHPDWAIDEAHHASVRRADVVLGDRDNAPADVEAAAEHARALVATAVLADPDAVLLAAIPDGAALPYVLVVDARTMRLDAALANPAPRDVRRAIADALDEPWAEPEPALIDGFFAPHEWELLQRVTPPGAPPPDPTNMHADSPAAAALGRALFFDEGLSPSGTVSCASCHRPDAYLADDRARALGLAEGDRRTPSIALAAHARWLFWDGRADSLWAQALGPMEDAREMGSSRAFVARRVLDAHGALYRAAFGELPDPRTWPANGMPGDPAFDGLDRSAQDAITGVFVNAGKAIEAWERTLRVRSNRLDAYVAGDLGALDREERLGLRLFVRHGCMQCHHGPRLTDDAFHDVRMPTGRVDGTADRGRLDGARRYRESELRADGPWSDAPRARRVSTDATLLGQFRTPPLRGIAHATHFGHGGTFGALASVMESYGTGGVPYEDASSAGDREPWVGRFGETVQWGLVPFLGVLDAELEEIH
ncbi:MAG: cytochrome c peroxidase [Sandaracinaceae bacterium]